AYAMPFGGTIGPWYGTSWQHGTGYSDPGTRLQLEPQELASGGIMNSRLPKDLVPNYSRFPGDQLGVASAGWSHSLVALSDNPGPFRASFNDYLDVTNFGATENN